MYNRYIPQSDGTYRKSRVPDSVPEPRCAPPPPPRPQPEEQNCREPRSPRPQPSPGRPGNRRQEPPRQQSVGSFFKQLFPRGFDTEDLLVVVLLLLMCDGGDGQNTALLTLAIYLFL